MKHKKEVKKDKGNVDGRDRTLRQKQAERLRIKASIFNGVEHIALTPRVQTALVYLTPPSFTVSLSFQHSVTLA